MIYATWNEFCMMMALWHMVQNLANNRPNVLKQGKIVPNSAKQCRTGTNRAKQGQTRPNAAKCGQMRPNVAKHGQTQLNVAKRGQIEPNRAQTGPHRAIQGLTEPNWAHFLWGTLTSMSERDQTGSNRVNWTKRGKKEPFRANLG